MAIAGNVRGELVRKMELYEGRVNHLYVDSVGMVTVGVGHAVPSEQACLMLPLWTMKDGRADKPATDDQLLEEYRLVAAQPRGMKAEKYKHKLIMLESTINVMRNADLNDFYAELKKRYTVSKGYKQNFDDFPPDAQIALMDMIFNLGGPKLMKKFPSMNAAIKQGNWAMAAEECNRPQVPPQRNGFVRKKFLQAAADAPVQP